MYLHAALAASILATTFPGPLYRPDTPGPAELWTFDPGDTVLTFGSGNFLLHYTTAGTHAVPAGDLDLGGVPDHVESLAADYEEALAFYTGTLGYDAPEGDLALAENGGDARLDVYLVDFAFQSDGAFEMEACAASGADCTGFIAQENDFAGYGYPSIAYANRLVSSHELFHFVQAGYRPAPASELGEGTAVWASEQFDPSFDDLEYFSEAVLEDPGRSLDVPPTGPVPAFSYGTSLFFQFLSERTSPDVIRALFEDQQPAEREWLAESLPGILAAEGTTFEEEMAAYAVWNLYTDARADAAEGYASGDGYVEVAMESATLPAELPDLRVFHASAQYYEAAPGERPTVSARLTGADADLEGMRVFVAVLSPDAVLELHEPAVDGDEGVSTAGATTVVAVVVNTASSGESRRPSLCFGSPAEVEACAGGGDGAGRGCGCSLTSSRAATPHLLGVAVVLTIGLLLRRRR